MTENQQTVLSELQKAHRAGRALPSAAAIARATNVQYDSVKYALRALEKKQLIKRTGRNVQLLATTLAEARAPRAASADLETVLKELQKLKALVLDLHARAA